MLLVIRFELEPGVFEEITIKADKIAKWINTHSIENRLIVFNAIDLDPKNKKEALKVLGNISDELLKSDLQEKELFTLMSTFDYYAKKVREKINEK